MTLHFAMTRGRRPACAALLTLLLVVLTACGGDDESSNGKTSSSEPALGEPLPQDVYGAWLAESIHENDVSRISYLPPEHRVCRDLVRTRSSCWLAESVKGGGKVDLDQRGQPLVVAWGEAGMRGGEMVTRIVSEPKPECVGTTSTARVEVRGNWLHIEPTSPICEDEQPPPGRLRSTYDRQ